MVLTQDNDDEDDEDGEDLFVAASVALGKIYSVKLRFAEATLNSIAKKALKELASASVSLLKGNGDEEIRGAAAEALRKLGTHYII